MSSNFSKSKEIIFTSIILLFFIQLFSDFVESTYILSLMTTSLNENTLSVVFFFSPIILLFLKDEHSKLVLLITGSMIIVFRILEPIFTTTSSMVLSGIGLGSFLIFFPLFLRLRGQNEEIKETGSIFGISFAIAILSSLHLRTIFSSLDVSNYDFYQFITLSLGIIAFYLLFPYINSLSKRDSNIGVMDSSQTSGVIFTVIALSCVIFFVMFAFGFPIVISRWVEIHYRMISIIITSMTILFALLVLYKPQILEKLTSKWFALNLIFVVSVVFVIFINQIQFYLLPKSAYPYESPDVLLFTILPFIIMLCTYPIILLDFIILINMLSEKYSKMTVRSSGKSFLIGFSVFMLAMIFALIFTSVWGFIPVLGPLFRDLFWLIFALIGIFLIFGLRKSHFISYSSIKKLKLSPNMSTLTTSFLMIILVGNITGIMLEEGRPKPPSEPKTSIRFLTYNIQQGVDEFANKNYYGQFKLINNTIKPDIIGLQETYKIAGNSDPTQFLANYLEMYSYYGPKSVTGTTGVSLLSKYPIITATTYYHYSTTVDKKQTATIEAEIDVNGTIFNVYVTHTFGRMEAKVLLQEDVLKLAEGKENVVFMGDFNFKPFSEGYNVTTQQLDDSWYVTWPTGTDDTGHTTTDNIDHIFVSPGMNITNSQYSYDPQSDHPAYWIDVRV